jgi:hypothetical protein
VARLKTLTLNDFKRQRQFIRMVLGENPVPEIPEKQFLICGPGFGSFYFSGKIFVAKFFTGASAWWMCIYTSLFALAFNS